jgi:tripartite-type tricarboxylate transporter receptor subunit TctC
MSLRPIRTTEETMTRAPSAFALAACIGFAVSSPVAADAVADFYKGKSIRMIVGTSPGDYDMWARFIVRYLGKHIPGNPSFVVENMPGAGSLIAANYLFNRAARDGTVLGSVSRNIPHYAFAKKPNVQFDPLKFHWIGSPELTHRGCFARSDVGVNKAADLFTHELMVGTDGAGTSLSEMPMLLKNLLGMKFRTIDGYKGSNHIVLAIARNEVGGICQTVTAFANSGQKMLDDGTVRLLFTTERERVPRYKVPTVFEFAKTDEQRAILDFQASTLETGRPWLAPPGVPGERIAALRAAFDATMRDPAFLDEAAKRKLQVTPRTGQQIEAVLRKAAAFPPALLAKMKKMTQR